MNNSNNTIYSVTEPVVVILAFFEHLALLDDLVENFLVAAMETKHQIGKLGIHNLPIGLGEFARFVDESCPDHELMVLSFEGASFRAFLTSSNLFQKCLLVLFVRIQRSAHCGHSFCPHLLKR